MEVTGHLYRWHPSTGRAALMEVTVTCLASTCNICGDRESCPCMEVTGHLYRWHPSTCTALTRALLHVIFVGTGRAVHAWR